MKSNENHIQPRHGTLIPDVLKNFVADPELKDKLPVRLVFENVPFILELQYFLDIFKEKNIDEHGSRVRFAVTTDGHDLLADLASIDLDIWQEEIGEIYSLGVTMRDFLEAKKETV